MDSKIGGSLLHLVSVLEVILFHLHFCPSLAGIVQRTSEN